MAAHPWCIVSGEISDASLDIAFWSFFCGLYSLLLSSLHFPWCSQMPRATLTLIQMLPLRYGQEEAALKRDHNLNASGWQLPQISHIMFPSLHVCAPSL